MERVEQVLRKLSSNIAEKNGFRNYTIKLRPTSSGGANYTSILYYITLSAKDKDLHLFAKVAPENEAHRESIPVCIFDTERFIYTELAEKFRHIEDKYAVPEEDRFVFCKCYGYNLNHLEESIVLENLAERGFIVYDRMKSVDWPYASKAVEMLAKFHALGMVLSEEFPEMTKTIYETYDQRVDSTFESMTVALERFIEMSLSSCKPEHKGKLEKFFEIKNNRNFQFFTKPRRKCVLIHGDYRPSNILHKVNEDGSVEVIPCDYQTIRSGCVTSDLIYFIICGADKEFRAQYYDQLIEVYYQQLCKSLRAMHYDPEKIYSRVDFDKELREVLPFGLVISTAFPLLTVDPEDAPDINKDDLFKSMANIKANDAYVERFNGVVDDYVRWGVL